MSTRSTILATTLLAAMPIAAAIARGPIDPPVPPENPITEPKRMLGKVLFWDAQLSTDNTVACGTCHIPAVGGADPRFAVNPGPDAIFGNDDDRIGSRGVIRSDANRDYAPDPVFGLDVQVTKRAANPFFLSHAAAAIFWDGAAGGTFIDPETGAVSIASGGALETQALVPILSAVEMGHAGRDWDHVRGKLETARPLALATDLPADVAERLDQQPHPTYPDLFTDAFGDGAITAERIAFALATYERTLVPDQTKWDAFMAGDPDALSEQEQRGWALFQSGASRCNLCHVPPRFTDNTFRNIGLRPWEEDPGRMSVTGDFRDRGKFKVPGLRNIILKPTYMHNGRLDGVSTVLEFYTAIKGTEHFEENRDPLIDGILMTAVQREDINTFLRNALIDRRVPREEFPFDRPTLHTELVEANPSVIGQGEPGTGGVVPRMIAEAPPNIGNGDFRVGVRDALGGAEAFIGWSDLPPGADGRIEPRGMFGPIVLSEAGGAVAGADTDTDAGADADTDTDTDTDTDADTDADTHADAGTGYGTWHAPIAPDDEQRRGRRAYFQWFIEDPAGADGIVTSDVARVTYFLADPTECDACPADLDCNGEVAFNDLLRVLERWGPCPDCREDMTGNDGIVGVAELVEILSAWGAGCGGG